MFHVISEKELSSKDFTSTFREIKIWENFNNDSCNFSYKFAFLAFVTFLSFCRVQKQESNFQQVCGLVTRNISVFFLFVVSSALLRGHAEFNEVLWRNFLTCYSCSYHSSMLLLEKFNGKHFIDNWIKLSLVTSVSISSQRMCSLKKVSLEICSFSARI